MNQPAPSAPDHPGAAASAPIGEDVAAALRLPGPLGRARHGLPVAEGAPAVPSALSTFNRLTGHLDRDVDDAADDGDEEDAGVVTELGGTAVEPLRVRVRSGG